MKYTTITWAALGGEGVREGWKEEQAEGSREKEGGVRRVREKDRTGGNRMTI